MDSNFNIKLGADTENLEASIQSSLNTKTFKIKVETETTSASTKGGSSAGGKGTSTTANAMEKAAKQTENFTAKLVKLKTESKLTDTQFASFNKSLDDINSKFKKDKNVSKFSKELNTLKNRLSQTVTQNKLVSKSQNQLMASSQKAQNAIKRMGEANKLSKTQVQTFTGQIEQLRQQLASGAINEQQFAVGLKQIASQAKGASNPIATFARNVGSMIKGFAGFQLAATVTMQAINAVKAMVGEVMNVDKAMVELNKVYDASDKELNAVKQRAFELADELGTVGTNVISATTEFKRMGYTIEQSLDLARIAVMMTNVAEGIDDAGEAANILSSILKGTNTDVKYAGSLLDRLNEISNNSAVSFDALANMTQEAAATMNILGNNLDETMGLLTGAYAVLQDESVANGIQTIGLRIAGLNEDLEAEAGLSNEVVEALQKYAGISAFDEQSGDLKSTYAILEELAGVWDTIDKNQQSALLNTLAGKRQADVAAAILNNWEGVSDAVEQAANSMGSAEKEQEAYLDSIEGRINRVKNMFQQFSDAIIGSEIVKILIDVFGDILNAVGQILSVLSKILKFNISHSPLGLALKSLKNTLQNIAAVFQFIGRILDWVYEKIDNLINKVKNSWLGKVFSGVSSAYNKTFETIRNFLTGTKETSDEYNDLADSFEKTEKAISDYDKAIKDLSKNQKELANSLQEYLDLQKSQHEKLEKEQELQEKILKVEEARQKLAEARQKRTRIFRAGVGFVYEEDAADIQSAQAELSATIDSLAEYKYDLAYDRAEEFIEKLTALLESDDITEGWAELFENFGDLLDTEFADYINKAREFIREFNNVAGVDSGISLSTAPMSTNMGETSTPNVSLSSGLSSMVSNPSRNVTSVASSSGTVVVEVNGPINLPNVTDADGFIDAMVAIGNNSIPKLA